MGFACTCPVSASDAESLSLHRRHCRCQQWLYSSCDTYACAAHMLVAYCHSTLQAAVSPSVFRCCTLHSGPEQTLASCTKPCQQFPAPEPISWAASEGCTLSLIHENQPLLLALLLPLPLPILQAAVSPSVATPVTAAMWAPHLATLRAVRGLLNALSQAIAGPSVLGAAPGGVGNISGMINTALGLLAKIPGL